MIISTNKIKVKVKVVLGLAVYRKSAHLHIKPLETTSDFFN
jgi:hypothetical protein